MIISHRSRYIFVKTRKTAGTSIEIALSRHAGPKDVITAVTPDDEQLRRSEGGVGPQRVMIPPWRWRRRELRGLAQASLPRFYNHMPAAAIRSRVGEETWRRYFTFTVERNPWDLAVSAWHWERSQSRIDLSFDAYVHSPALARYSNWKLYTVDDEVIVDEVIRYDQLADGLRGVCQRLGLPRLDLPRAKAGSRSDRRPYQEFYTPGLADRVGEVFSREIHHFGWRF